MQRSDIPQNKLIRYNLVSFFHAVRMIQYLYSIPKQYLGPALVLLAASSSAVALGALSIPWSNLWRFHENPINPFSRRPILSQGLNIWIARTQDLD